MVKNSPSATSRSTPATAASCPYMRRTPVSLTAGTPLAGVPLSVPTPAVPVLAAPMPADATPWLADAASCLPIAVSPTRALRHERPRALARGPGIDDPDNLQDQMFVSSTGEGARTQVRGRGHSWHHLRLRPYAHAPCSRRSIPAAVPIL